MFSTERPGLRVGWRRAFLLSALLHALGFGALTLVPGPKVVKAVAHSGPTITAIQLDEGNEDNTFIFPRFGEQTKSKVEVAKKIQHDTSAKSVFEPVLVDTPPTNPSIPQPS